jgi:glutamate N-acetyltransferase/amino-acid N-acetyltransferase
MAVNLPPVSDLRPVPGVRIGTTCAGVKQTVRDDLVVMEFAPGTRIAGVFTRSAFKAAPVLVSQRHLARRAVRAFVINSGNANAATGDVGIEDALRCCERVAQRLGVSAEAVLPFSTGVIGVRLPVEKIERGIDDATARLAADWLPAARAIMTTDTAPKALSASAEIGGRTVTVTGIAKGAGMIKPDMATMLAYVATDASIAQACLERLVRRVNEKSFNRISIDGDTSTNDSFVLAATGIDGVAIDDVRSPGYRQIERLVTSVATGLAQRIVRDGEGATKFVTVRVGGARSRREALRVAYTIAESPLVKTALFASDPNWGRFCMAIGRAGIADLDTAGVSLHLDDVCVAERGMIASTYTEARGAGVMAKDEFTVSVDLGRGRARETVWTCDFSYEYVKINAEYRT